ncbi:hypothetical protein C1878_03795 [Gordonibacter sp. 28C]|nr:hypothetical protein C1878_03795 [Gordonibacter sp. 28C]
MFVNSPVFQVSIARAPASGTVPKELPPPCSHFVDRNFERSLLDNACESRLPSPNVVVISGMPGVGKSALVSAWGNKQRKSRFLDGQLYLDLCPTREGGASPVADALRSKLSQMAGPDAVSHTRPADLAAQYRSFTCDKDILVVLENVSSYADIEPFIPNSPSSLVLATSSRTDIGSLDADITTIPLGELDQDDAFDLFTRVAFGMSGEKALRALPPDEAEGVASVLEHCCGLPLAIRASANILRQGGARSAVELHRRLVCTESEVFRRPELADVWRECCRALDQRCLSAIRAFAALSSSEATLGTLAAVWGVGPVDARSIVGELLGFGFVSLDSPPDDRGLSLASEVSLPRAIRAYLRAQMAEEGSLDGTQASSITALLSHYRVLVQELDHSLKPARLRLYDRIPSNNLVRELLVGRTEFEVFESECALLDSIPRIMDFLPASNGDVWAIGDALWSFYNGTSRYQAGYELFSACSRLARRAGSALAASRLAVMASGMLAKLGRAAEGLGPIDAALAEHEGSSRLDVLSMFHEFRGICLHELGRCREAVAEFSEARAGNESRGNSRGCCLQDLLLSRTYRKLAEAGKAEEAARRSIAEVDRDRDKHTYAKSAQELCFALALAGKHEEAISFGKESAELFAQLGEYRRAYRTLFAVAESLHALGKDEDAASVAEGVRDYYGSIGLDEERERVARFIDSLCR